MALTSTSCGGSVISPNNLGPGALVGRWEIIKRLGSGGMADVFLARARGEAGFEKTVALKRILPPEKETPDLMKKIQYLAQISPKVRELNAAVSSAVDAGAEARTAVRYWTSAASGASLSSGSEAFASASRYGARPIVAFARNGIVSLNFISGITVTLGKGGMLWLQPPQV